MDSSECVCGRRYPEKTTSDCSVEKQEVDEGSVIMGSEVHAE